MIFRTSLLFTLLLLSGWAYSQEDWKKKKDKDGIQVYTKHVEGSSLKAIKAVTTFDCPIEVCSAVLRDIDHLTELFPDCEKAIKVEQSEDEQIHHLHLNAPWPVSDRDATFYLRYRYDPDSQTLTVQADVINDRYPKQKGLVRLTKGVGTWTFKKNGARTSLVYHFHGEPGGSIPAWLANSVVEDNPLEMLQNFHSLVKLDRYQGQTFGFLR